MSDKPDPKDAGRPESPGGKRPHATLDLKATEVKTPPPSASAPAASATAGGEPSAAPRAGAKGTSSASSSSSSSSAAPSDKPAAGAESAAKASAPGSASSGAAPRASSAATPPPKARAATGGVLSHLAAGLVGGGLVYAAAALLGPDALPVANDTSELKARIAALEAAPRESANVDALGARVGDAEARLAKLDELAQRLAALNDAQGALKAETEALAAAAREGDGGKTAERIGKLEEQLRLIAASAPGSDGHVPQVAALAGKISDLEQALATQVASLRKSLPADVEQRLAAAEEASQAATAATARLDRTLADLTAGQARRAQETETQKAEAERLAAAVEAAKEEAAKVSSAIMALKSAVDSQLKAVARPADVAAAIGPVATKLAELEQKVANVVSSEQSRKQNAERIVLSLELSNLKRALDRGQGQGYAAELEEVRKAAGGTLDLAALERFKDTGVATPAELKAEFRPVMHAVLDADLEPADGSVIERLLAGAKSVVRVRKVSHEAGDTSTEAIVARIETALGDGRLGDVVQQAKTLPARAQVPLEDWLAKVAARQSVDQAIAAIEERLKASLAGSPEPAAAPQPAPPAQN